MRLLLRSNLKSCGSRAPGREDSMIAWELKLASPEPTELRKRDERQHLQSSLWEPESDNGRGEEASFLQIGACAVHDGVVVMCPGCQLACTKSSGKSQLTHSQQKLALQF